ncbi:hypothetical protein M1247_21910 [Mycobacterium sp. 21AC1]|uniref:hypothetical protein n=1 Tax=[Mycobacterium] appelbergii TaxID=2939269 RepID=UPI00293946B8|nr:hypothetical protein [Mycobacterium sp. 21AC1]MDV3127597.1 hypothetical protein [Mycobacterium sp. 21AC1]
MGMVDGPPVVLQLDLNGDVDITRAIAGDGRCTRLTLDEQTAWLVCEAVSDLLEQDDIHSP